MAYDHQQQANAGRLVAVAPVPESNGKTIFVGASDGGVWRTKDGGKHWDTGTDFFSSLRITALATDSGGSYVYAATQIPLRLLVSGDGGYTWSELTFPGFDENSAQVYKLIVDPISAGTVYALVSPSTGNPGVLRKSANFGASWNTVLDGVGVEDVVALPGITVATAEGKVYRSAGGGPWTEIALPPPPSGPPGSGYAALAAVPGNPSRIYLAFLGADQPLYRSDNGAATWVFQARHPPSLNFSTFRGGADGTTLYRGNRLIPDVRVQRSTDGGSTWSQLSGPYHVDANAIATTASPDAMYVGTDGGLWRFNENASTWENLNGNMATLLVYHAAHSPADPGAIAGGTQDNGLIIWRGAGWIVAMGGDVGDVYLRADDPDRGGGTRFLSGNLIKINGTHASLLLPDPPPCAPLSSVRHFALDPTDPLRVCAANDQVKCSTNGVSGPWCITSLDIGAKALVLVNHNQAWVTTTDGHVLRTTSAVNGFWNDVTSDLPIGGIVGLSVDPHDPSRALVLADVPGQDPHVYETTDAGTSWLPVGTPPVLGGQTQVSSFAVAFAGPFPAEEWFVGTWSGLLVSDDFGATWTDTNVPHARVTDIRAVGHAVTAATFGRGVFQKTVKLTLPDSQFLALDPFWWLRHNPVEDPGLWASVLLRRNKLIDEVRLPQPQGGRSFRRRDDPFGPHDFHVAPGMAFLVKGKRPGMVPVSGNLLAQAVPTVLREGWNAVGVAYPRTLTASSLIADTAAQGIRVLAVQDGGRRRSFVDDTDRPGGPNDFAIDPTSGYWVLASSPGGVWTPGANLPPPRRMRALLAKGAGDEYEEEHDAERGNGGGHHDRGEAGHARRDGIKCRIRCAGRGHYVPADVHTCGECEAAAARACAGAGRPIAHCKQRHKLPPPEPCPDLGELLAEVPADIGDRFPEEIMACVGEMDTGAAAVCDEPPSCAGDPCADSSACARMPKSRGCAVGIRLGDIALDASDRLRLTFAARVNGTATTGREGCDVSTQATGATFVASLEPSLDPPVLDLVVSAASLADFSLAPTRCGAEVDDAIAAAVRHTVETALRGQLKEAIGGLGLTCSPYLP